MTDAFVIGVAAPLAAIIGAGLSYLATRKRDQPHVELGYDKLALEAMAEYLSNARDDLQRMRTEARAADERMVAMQRALEECLQRALQRD